MDTSETPSRDSDSSDRINRIFQRSSALLRGRPVSISSAHTTDTVLPQYSILDPASMTSVSSDLIRVSNIEDDETSSPGHGQTELRGLAQAQAQQHGSGPLILRCASTLNGAGESSNSETAKGENLNARIREYRYGIFSFPVKGTKPWVTLHLYSPQDKQTHMHFHSNERSRRPTQPQVYGGSTLKGIVEISADKPIAIRDIKVTIKGKVITGANADESHTFLNQTTNVWNKSNGDPRPGGPPARSESGSGSGSEFSRGEAEAPFDGKFTGYYEIPFFCHVPTVCDTSSGSGSASMLALFRTTENMPMDGITPFSLTGHARTTVPSSLTAPTSGSPTSATSGLALASPRERISNSNSQGLDNHDNGDNSVTRFGTALPPTFFDTSIATTIQYEVYLQISHGRFRPNTRIATGITYLPTVTPPPMPRSRGIIYEAISGRGARDDCHSVVIPSPLSDPAGWMKCTSATLNGVMLDMSSQLRIGH